MSSATDLLPKTYEPNAIEQKWYAEWLKRGYFNSKPDSRKAFTIVIPPPNITGVLHMGHMLNNTIQDVLVRRARMQGYNACWIPGTDHASIATEAKVVQMLNEKGISKSHLTRDAFLEHAWTWKEKYGNIILDQLKKLGASCDWNRTRFTMEPDLSEAVNDVFVDLFKKQLIYRGLRMVNWDPMGKTALSDEEVLYKEVQGQLYYIKYKFCDGSGYLSVATTRPETLLADVALCVNPDDERYTACIGKTVFIPLTDRKIPVISDAYVSSDFGTGCLKITPAHDINDYQIGQKHNLPGIDILDDSGRLNANAGISKYIGKDRFEVRKQIVKDLETEHYLEKTESYTHQVGTSERTGAVIEPRLSQQWFVDMKRFLKKHPQVLTAVMQDEICFHPSKMKNTYRYWIENIKDWCISRQLWWGHRIPAWYDSKGRFVVAKTHEAALLEYATQFNETPDALTQDEDVLDTWFSSWLWPISVFDGFKNTESTKSELQYYYPTQDLVTAPDIIFFWVARMIMAGYEWMGEKPFKNVYFTGIVRDKQRRKMSKSLGNSPDPLELIDKYGADAVRMGILLSAPAGNDILFDIGQIEQGRNFCNKIWNAFKLISGFKADTVITPEAAALEAIDWFKERLSQQMLEIDNLLRQYKISDALMCIYKLIWDDFCAWYLEAIKPHFSNGTAQPLAQQTIDCTHNFFEILLTLLHPWMPFITEELWHMLKPRDANQALTISKWPIPNEYNINTINRFECNRSFILQVRNLRAQHQISPKLALTAECDGSLPLDLNLIQKLGNLDAIHRVNTLSAGVYTFQVETMPCGLHLNNITHNGFETARIQKELEHLQDFLQRTDSKLKNEKFIAHAKPEVIELERKKLEDATLKIQNLNLQLEHLKSL